MIDDRRNRRLPESDVTIIRDLAYRDGTSRQWRLDLAMPRVAAGKPRPALVVIHGGGWIEGDKSSFTTRSSRSFSSGH
jgi:acetyl esterase/lipase